MALLSANITPGDYVLASVDYSDMPKDFTGTSFLLSVRAHGSFYVQRVTATDKPFLAWSRTVRPTEAYDWRKTCGLSDRLVGATIVCLGDSLTENSNFPALLAGMTGATVISAGMGGTRLTDTGGPFAGMHGVQVADAIASGDYSDLMAAAVARRDATSGVDDNTGIITALAAVNWSKVTHVICFWGTNDWNNNVQLGLDMFPAQADMLVNRDTIRGGVNYIMGQLMTRAPQARIMWVGPLFRARKTVGDGLNSDDYPNSNLTWLHDVSKAICETARNRWHMPSLDLYSESGINKANYIPFLRDQTIDGGHPVKGVGTQRIAEKMLAFLQRDG